MEDYIYNNFTYKGKSETGEYIIHNIPKPDKIFKYYSMSKYTVDALIRGYLYASHPFDLNDTLDSTISLYSTTQRINKIHYQKFYVGKQQEEIDNIYKEDENNKRFIADYYTMQTNLYGIISMASETNNDLIWPHYTQEQGFQIMFNTHKLEQSIKDHLSENDDYIGLYPVNYCQKLQTINISKFKSFLAPFLYSTSVKMNCWSYEKEWRFLIGKQNMYIPFTKMGLHHGTDRGIKENRFVYYDKTLIERIVLGKNFFNGLNFIINPIGHKKWELSVREKEYKNFYEDFLNYVFENLNEKFYLSESNGNPSGTDYYIERRIAKANLEKDNNIYTLSMADENLPF